MTQANVQTASVRSADFARPTTDLSRRGWLAFAVMVAVGILLDISSTYFPADMPVFLPWQFQWPVYLATTLMLGWYFVGLRRMTLDHRPPLWRRATFVVGVLSVYGVLHTHFDYLAQHMFFLHRAQHFVLHDLGTFLIALAWPWPTIRQGMPGIAKSWVDSRPVQGALNLLQHPVLAPIPFVGSLYFWLVPQIHDRAMLDIDVYNAMNFSVTLEGLLFWSLVLDPRPKPPARMGFAWRALMMLVIEPPEMLIGAIISLSGIDFYTAYRICGRVLPIDGATDQHYGGLIIWILGGLMGLAGLLAVLSNIFMHEERGAGAVKSSELTRVAAI